MAIDLGLMHRRDISGPPRVYCPTHSTGNSHKCGLGFQITISSQCVRINIPREIASLEHAGILMLQDKITLQFADVTLCICQPSLDKVGIDLEYVTRYCYRKLRHFLVERCMNQLKALCW